MTPPDGTNRSSVTLIIPTVHHRARLYTRALRHLDLSGFRGPIVVSDHSPPEHAHAIAEATSRYPDLDVRVLRHPPAMHFLTRLALCATAAETPYVHLHADDDFLVIATLGRLVGELERHPECVAAMGINLHLRFDTGEVLPLRKGAIPYPTPFDRLIAQLEFFSSVLYALRRRDELIASFAFTVERCPDVQFWQYLESCVASLHGPIALVDDLHYVREIHPDKWSATLFRERSPEHFPYLILAPEFQPRLAAFRGALLAACAADGVAVDAQRLDAGLIHLLHRGFVAMGLPEHSTNEAPPPPTATLEALRGRPTYPEHPAVIEFRRIVSIARG